MPKEASMNIHELSKETGVPERTIRYYIEQELLEPPTGWGRSASYDELQVGLLKRIKRLQEGGMTINEIRNAMELDREEAEAYAKKRQEKWLKYILPRGIELHVREDVDDKDKWMTTRIIHFIRVMIDESDQRKRRRFGLNP
jgi:DNA-binding transcriptional MerR regulator